MESSQNLNQSITVHTCPLGPKRLPTGFTPNAVVGLYTFPLWCRYPSPLSQKIRDAALKKKKWKWKNFGKAFNSYPVFFVFSASWHQVVA